MRPPRISASSAMTTYFMRLQIPEVAAGLWSMPRWPRFPSAGPAARAARFEARGAQLASCSTSSRPPSGPISTVTADVLEVSMRRCSGDALGDSSRRVEGAVPPSQTVRPSPVRQLSRSTGRPAPGPGCARIARRRRSAMARQCCSLRRRLLLIQSHDAALGRIRHDARCAQLRGFLDDPIHALAARDALRECEGQRATPARGAGAPRR